MSEAPKPHAAEAKPFLSLYAPEPELQDTPEPENANGLSADMTLPEFWEEFAMPICYVAAGRADGTIELYRNSMRLWAECTPNPALRLITDKTMAGFIEIYSGYPGKHGGTVTDSTIAKQLRHIQAIVDLAGPWNRRHRNAQELIKRPPAFPSIDVEVAMRPPLSLDEIARWLNACDAATRPSHLTRTQRIKWHRALVLVAYNTGLRVGTITKMTKSMLGDDGWLKLPGRIMKTGKGGEFYCNAHARAALRSIWHFPGELIFPWHDGQSPKSDVIQKEKKKMWRKAEIKLEDNGYHGLRRACLNWVTPQNPLAAQHIAGHAAAGNVLATNYVGPRAVVPQFLDKLPRPRRSNCDPNQMMFVFSG